MLVRLLYASRSVGPQTSTVTARILATARVRNPPLGVTGLLCQGQGLYLQVLEGPRSAVNQLFVRLVVDPRHRDVQLLLLEEIESRRFPDWSMAHVQLRDRDALLRSNDRAVDPFEAPGTWVMAQLDHLTANGQRIEPPAD